MNKIILSFFKDEEYAGWYNIATKLIETEECIVAGNTCIWKGGIGNFISTEPAKDAIDCLLYKFNKEEFMQSAWFIEHLNYKLDELEQEEYILLSELISLKSTISQIKKHLNN